MFKDKFPISIRREMEAGEPENPQATLSRLMEQKKDLEARGDIDAWPPEERLLLIQLTEQIEQLEENLHYKKAA